MILTLLVVIGFAACLAIERRAARADAPRRSAWLLPAGLGCFVMLELAWLAITGRMIFATVASVACVLVLVVISRRKRQLVAEPLVFSDIALVRHVIEHPDLYYLGSARDPRLLGAAATLSAAIAGLLVLEPPGLAPATRVMLGCGAVLVPTLLWSLAARAPVAGLVRHAFPRPDLETDLGRAGLLLTFLAYGLRWRREVTEPLPTPGLGIPSEGRRMPDVVIVLQVESFLDPVRAGLSVRTLPGLAKARSHALARGPLACPAHGAFTMRSEHEMLTGLDGSVRFRGFDPYLSTRGTVPPSLAERLAHAGYETVFMHPFRPSFFNREAVMRRLGFRRALWEADFKDAPRIGPYVADDAVIERILSEVAAVRGPIFVCAVTMENHGPWPAGRIVGLADAKEQYLLHLDNADRAIARLLDELEASGRHVLVCIYGDHPPILPGIDTTKPPETDYVVLRFGRPSEPAAERRLPIHELGRRFGQEVFGQSDWPSERKQVGQEPARTTGP